MTELTLHHLHKAYGRHVAVRGLSLTAPCGRITALLGPSGCGKTTILKLIAGLLPPDGGDVRFNGRSVLPIPAEKRGAVMVFQNHLLFPTMTVAENVGFGLRMRGVDRATIRQRVAAMLDLVKLPGLQQRRPHELSGGQQQRVALARALVVEPAVLLLDEPLSNLDAHLRNEMRDLIFGIQRQLDITTLVVTHDQEEAVILADQIALIFDGALQQVGAPEAFYERPLTPAVARFFGGVNFIRGHKRGGCVETALGRFQPAAGELPDGPVTLTIRPENVRLGREPAAANTLAGRIRGHVYAGTHTRFIVETADPAQPPLAVVAPAGSQHHHQDGDAVHLHLPADKIWLMPGVGREP
ncbi:MAG: ABC transporter ATP-binding protein [Anaerolineales bacterium]|nr:ABC transporter ATP-binding protein [Anaerolineales bacterium]